MKKLALLLSLIIVLGLVGCNLPTDQPTASSPDAVYTQAAQTVAAELTRVASVASPTAQAPAVPTATNTTAPTNTPVVPPTNTPIPCNLAGFIADVTYPDNSPVAPGQTFTKTWRLRNIGTCTWTSSYTVVFDSGNGMGVSAGYAQSLTSVAVPPNGTVDISVNLTAPAAAGTYRGDWHIREPGGQAFGTNFIVVVKVVNSNTVTLNPVAAETGTTRSDAGPWPDITAGESNSDITRTCEAFISFDIGSIPNNATITQVKLNLSNYTTTGNPFGLGPLNAYITTYGAAVDPSMFVNGLPSGNIADWGSTAALNNIEASPELKTALQSALGTGRIKIRLQFGGSNGDATKDRVTFNGPSLIVTYTTP